jgi:hypothetical protein
VVLACAKIDLGGKAANISGPDGYTAMKKRQEIN